LFESLQYRFPSFQQAELLREIRYVSAIDCRAANPQDSGDVTRPQGQGGLNFPTVASSGPADWHARVGVPTALAPTRPSNFCFETPGGDRCALRAARKRLPARAQSG